MACSAYLRRIAFPTGPQGWKDARLPRCKWRDQVGNIDLKGSGKAIEYIDGRIECALLDPAHICTVDVGIHPKGLLRDALRRAEASKISGDAGAAVHAAHATSLRPLKPSNIFDILLTWSRGSGGAAFSACARGRR